MGYLNPGVQITKKNRIEPILHYLHFMSHNPIPLIINF